MWPIRFAKVPLAILVTICSSGYKTLISPDSIALISAALLASAFATNVSNTCAPSLFFCASFTLYS